MTIRLTSLQDQDLLYRADVLDPIRNWISPWVPALQVLGGVFIAGCLVVIGMRAGAASAASNHGGGSGSSGLRNTLGSVGLLALGGIIIGAALVLAPLFIDTGTKSNTTPAPATGVNAGPATDDPA